MDFCDTHLDTLEEWWALLSYVIVPMFLWALALIWFDKFEYRFMQHHSLMLLPQPLHTLFSNVVLVALGYGAWRVDQCAGWDNGNAVALFLWLLLIVFMCIQIPVAFVPRSHIGAAVMSCMVAIYSIAVIVFFVIEDVGAGICAIVGTVYLAYWAANMVWLAIYRKPIKEDRKLFAEQAAKARQANATSTVDSEAAYQDLSTDGDYVGDGSDLYLDDYRDQDQLASAPTEQLKSSRVPARPLVMVP